MSVLQELIAEQQTYLADICRPPGDRGLLVCENVFAAIDPTCQRDLATDSSRSDHTGLRQEQMASINPGVQPVVPADINAARRRAPIGMFYVSCCTVS